MTAVAAVLALVASMAAHPVDAGGQAGARPRNECAVCSAEPTSPPEWFIEEIAYLTRDGGRWVADNGAYRTDDEPFGAYGLAWTRGISGITARGRLYGIDDRGREHDFWEIYLVWNEIDGAAVVMQVHENGTFGTGQLIASPDRSELVQTFRAPDDTMFELRHVETRSVDEKQSQSFRRSGDEWEPQRTYTWKRVRP